MVRGLYTAASGMVAQQKIQDVLAQNLANADTAGYKQDVAVFQSFKDMMIKRIHDRYLHTPRGGIDVRPGVGRLGTGAVVSGVVTDMAPGAIRQTNEKLDAALVGDGFFAVQTAAGVQLTRNGAFRLDAGGRIVTQKGDPVLGEGGPIRVNPRQEVTIADNGAVFQGSRRIDRLRVLQLPAGQNPAKTGETFFAANGAVPARNCTVRQGHLESSNVSVVREMIDMISGLRAYEAAQKAVQAQDDTLGRAVNDIPKV
ncbi:MAG: flagellar basal-body rod protein FlgF [Armatimonadetes bacterium]|nr:flagellar basal-body rod protein FlgF [Armatimonadota bacterium]